MKKNRVVIAFALVFLLAVGIFVALWRITGPSTPGPEPDDEIAIASCLKAMNVYVHGGASFYGLDEASQDFYLSALIDESAKNGHTLCSETQSWAF